MNKKPRVVGAFYLILVCAFKLNSLSNCFINKVFKALITVNAYFFS